MSNIEEITFGVEIETTIPASAGVRIGGYHAGRCINTAFVAAGQSINAPRFNDTAAWTVESDCSIMVEKPGHVRAEFVSPVLRGENGLKHLVEFVEFLRTIGASVNRSCGMHVHIGASGAAGGEEITAYIDRLARLVAFNSKALYAQTGTLGRENGHYCRPLNDRARAAVRRARRTKSVHEVVRGDRYQLLNLTNLNTRGTVEFRCFAGTLNSSKVLLHVFSAIALCIIARKTKTPATWDNRPLTGTKAITNFLKVRPMTSIVSAPMFTANFPRMLGKALEMAAKYDAQQAAVDIVILTRSAAAPQS